MFVVLVPFVKSDSKIQKTVVIQPTQNYINLFFSNQKLQNNVYALAYQTSGLKDNSTHIAPLGIGKFLFTPNSSLVSGLPDNFFSGWKTPFQINDTIGFFTIKVDLSSSGEFNGSILVKLDNGVAPKNLTKFIVCSPFSFGNGETQLSYDVVLPNAISINSFFYVELGLQIFSKKNAVTTVSLNLNSMHTTAILLPSEPSSVAYYRTQNNQVSGVTSPNYATVNLASGEYSKIASKDGVFSYSTCSVVTYSRYGDLAFRFTFNATGYWNNASISISDITFEWKGYYAYSGDSPNDIYLKYYKGSTSSWQSWQTLPSSNTDYNQSIGNGIGYNYTYLTKPYFAFGNYGDTQNFGVTNTLTIYNDYTCMKITYTIVGGVTNYVVSATDILLHKEGFGFVFRYVDSLSEVLTNNENPVKAIQYIVSFSQILLHVEGFAKSFSYLFSASDVLKHVEGFASNLNWVFSVVDVLTHFSNQNYGWQYVISYTEVLKHVESFVYSFMVVFSYSEVLRHVESFGSTMPFVFVVVEGLFHVESFVYSVSSVVSRVWFVLEMLGLFGLVLFFVFFYRRKKRYDVS